ncbi:4385_t:CDS:1, partial [Gigaspora margarita]
EKESRKNRGQRTRPINRPGFSLHWKFRCERLNLVIPHVDLLKFLFVCLLGISNNNLSLTDLTIFTRFKNLGALYIDNTNKNKLSQGIYNRIEGSLESLKDLDKLERLDIYNISYTTVILEKSRVQN